MSKYGIRKLVGALKETGINPVLAHSDVPAVTALVKLGLVTAQEVIEIQCAAIEAHLNRMWQEFLANHFAEVNVHGHE